MTTYVNIPDSDVDQDSPVTVALMSALRDNPSMVELATTTISNDTQADFTVFDNTLFGLYIFDLANVIPATNNVILTVRVSTDGGSSYSAGGSDYINVKVGGGVGSTGNGIFIATNVGSLSGNDGVSGLVNVHGAGLSKRTGLTFVTGWYDNAGNVATDAGLGSRLSAVDTDAIRFLFSSGDLESGVITMYGVLK